MRCKHTALLILFILAALVSVTGLWLCARRQQYALNRQLIAALVRGDNRQALALVNAGADPNTHCEPPPVPSLPELMKQLFHRPPPLINDSPTALLIACGADWNDDLAPMTQKVRPDVDAQLVQSMLTHGANVNAKDKHGNTPLTVIVDVAPPWIHRYIARANVREKDKGIVPGKDESPIDETLRALLTHGADPNITYPSGITPLMLAQYRNRTDLVALLRHYGARK